MDVNCIKYITCLLTISEGAEEKFYSLKEAVATIIEEDNMENIDIVVLPPSS